MCGIVVGVAHQDVVPILLEGLRKLEYRGYDSAGVAVLDQTLCRERAVGRVECLVQKCHAQQLSGEAGIAHTRWATHGEPSEKNAHPHLSHGLAVVHNGIIENYEVIRSELSKKGYAFESDTDTEVIAPLVHYYLQQGCEFFTAVQKASGRLVGAYAIAVLMEASPECIVLVRHGTPLVIGLGENGHYAASDASALLQVTRNLIYLEDGDSVQLCKDRVAIFDVDGQPVHRKQHVSVMSADAVELGHYRHYMLREIFEQPEAISNTLEMISGATTVSPALFGPRAAKGLQGVRQVLILACGTSYHAGLVARYWIESMAQLPCSVEIASEYRYRRAVTDPNTLVVAISQSGETADTLAALKYAVTQGMPRTLAICNVAESAIVREAQMHFITRAGLEIGVASTKAFTTQLAALALLTLVLAEQNQYLSVVQRDKTLVALRHLPVAVHKVLALEPEIAEWAQHFALKQHALFLGRGPHWPIAMEGALKLKEISYIHAEAYAAGELKHGPLALVDQNMPVIAVAPADELLEKLKSNLQSVRARGGELYVFADAECEIEESEGIRIMHMPEHYGMLSPVLHVVALQLLSYHAALVKGTDVDKPRNLAKSVTVE